MATGLGFKSKMGAGKQSAYRTAVDATDKILLISEGIEFDYQQVLHEYLHGSPGIQDSQRISEPVSGSIEFSVPYTEKTGTKFVSSTLPIAFGMGSNAWDSTNSVIQLTLGDTLPYGTFAWDKGQNTTYPWEAVGCYVDSFSLSGNAGEALKGSVEIKAYDLVISSTQNTVTELDALPTDVPTLPLFSDLTCRINQQGGTLSSSDNVGISGFTVSVSNALSDYEQSTPDNSTSHTDSKKTIQPIRNGFREVTFEITLPRYESDYFFDRLSSDNNLQCELHFDDPNSSNYFKIFLPNIKVENSSSPVGGAGAIQQTVSFKCYARNSASDLTFADSSTDDGEIWIETKDERTAVLW